MQAGSLHQGSFPNDTCPQKKSNQGQGSTDEQWNKEIQEFLRVVVNASTSAGQIRNAWKKLRQNYAQKFDASVYASGPSKPFEPFPLWAAETFDDGILSRVLQIEFSNLLAQCHFISLLRSTAAMANISMWHMILYFGTSFFSESRIKAVRKRIQVFTRSADGTAWPFTEAYKSLLRKTAVKQGSRLNSTSIPCSNTSPLFSSPDIFSMAPNQEFQPGPQVIAKVKKTGITGVPAGNAGVKEFKGRGNGQQGTVTEQADATTLVSDPINRREQGKVQSSGDEGDEDDEEKAAKHQPLGRITRTSTREKPTLPPQNLSYAADQPQTSSLNTLKPSIETPQPTRENSHEPAWKTGSLMARLNNGNEANFQGGGRLTRAQRLDRQLLAKNITGQGRDEAHMANVRNIQREASCNPTAAGTPSHLKRRVKEEDGAGPSKRLQIGSGGRPAATAGGTQRVPARAFEKFQEWTDATTLQMLGKLQKVRPEEVVVVDGMKSYGPGGHPPALTAADIRKGTILLPLKLSDGYRILAVLRLGVINPHDPAVEKPKQGTILFYDPAQSNGSEFIRGFQLAARVAQLLAYILPSYDADPGAWDTRHCAMPKQQMRGSTSVALCLAAMCVVGSLPRMAQIPEDTDWTFWRHFILGCFYGSDESVRTQTDKFRLQLIQTLIRQGQVRGRTPEYQYEADEEIECVGHTTTDPMQRITQRDANAQRLFQMVHQSHIICLDLMSHLDRGMASLKTMLDKSCLLHKGPEITTQAGSSRLKKEEDEEEEQATGLASYAPWDQQEPAELSLEEHNSRQLVFEDAARCITMAIEETSVWRNAIQQAVLVTDESIA